MDTKELRAKGPAELKQELNALLKAHFGLRMQQATQQLTNTSELTKTRRAIAPRAHYSGRESEAGMSEAAISDAGRPSRRACAGG
jgi:large subunit ribosomal protein L29